MPNEYLSLEAKTDQIKQLYESMGRLARFFAASDYDPSVSESVKVRSMPRV
jgi:hypothetical protein